MSEGCCDTITLFKGEDGRTIYNGSGAPTLTTVNEGDFYIDTTAWEIYGPYSVSGWGTGTSLIGPAGGVGPQGNGIVSTLWTSNSGGQPQGTVGTTDTYTITYTDATTNTFTVTNGSAAIDPNTWDMTAVAFVDTAGNDGTAIVGDGNLPYLTINAAAAASTMVLIKPGDYNEVIILVNGVTYYFMPGSTLIGGHFKDTVSTGKVCNVLGSLNITTQDISGALEINSDINLHFEFDHITGVKQAFFIAGAATVRIYGRFISTIGQSGFGISFRDSTNVQVTLTEGFESNHTALFFRGNGVGLYSGSCIFNSPYIKTLEASPLGLIEKGTVAIDQFSSDAFIELNTNLINESITFPADHFGGLFIANAIEVGGGVRGGIYLNGNIVSNDHGLYTGTEASFFDLYINGDIKSNTRSAIETQLRGAGAVPGTANIIIRGSKIISELTNQLGSGRNYTFMDCTFYSATDDIFDYVEFGTPVATTGYFYNCIAESIAAPGLGEFIQGLAGGELLTTGWWNTVSKTARGVNTADVIVPSGFTPLLLVVVPKN